MPAVVPRLAGTATFTYHNQLCEVLYVLSDHEPEGGPWDAVPLGGTTLWKTGGNGADLALALPTGPAATETVWRVGGHYCSARFRLLRSRPASRPGLVVVPIGRRWLEIAVRRRREVVGG